jgi:hypothetical protein
LIGGLVSAAALTAVLIVATIAVLNTLHSNSFLRPFFIDFLCLSTIRRKPLALADQAAASPMPLPPICLLAIMRLIIWMPLNRMRIQRKCQFQPGAVRRSIEPWSCLMMLYRYPGWQVLIGDSRRRQLFAAGP